MNRDTLIDLLARLIADGEITDEDAAQAIADFDAGYLPDLAALGLPDPPASSIVGYTEEDRTWAILALAALFGVQMATQPGPAEARTVAQLLQRTTAGGRIRQINQSQDQFTAAVRALAGDLSNGRINLAQWQGRINEEIRRHVLAGALVGSRAGSLGRAQLARVDRVMREQAAFVSRFADQIAARALAGAPMSEAQIGARSALYAGSERAEFFRAQEEADEAAGARPDGDVIEYVAVDDAGTCEPCSDAQGYYLPGQGPMPGEICLGGGNCRCERISVYLPGVYAELIGAPIEE